MVLAFASILKYRLYLAHSCSLEDSDFLDYDLLDNFASYATLVMGCCCVGSSCGGCKAHFVCL